MAKSTKATRPAIQALRRSVRISKSTKAKKTAVQALRRSARISKSTSTSSTGPPPVAPTVKKPKKKAGEPCQHCCPDKTKCKHKCCNISLRLYSLPKCDDFISCGDMLVALLSHMPIEDLFRFRSVNKIFKDTIEASKDYRQAAFLDAEPAANFTASIKEALLRPQTKDAHSDQDRLIRPIFAETVLDAPGRRVRVNPFFFVLWSTDDLGTTGRQPDHKDQRTADGHLLYIHLNLKFNPMTDVLLNDDSSCMEMFLTQPPVKEVLVHFPQYGFYGRHHRHNGLTFYAMPKQLLATDEEDGLRYRHLYEFLHLLRAREGVEHVTEEKLGHGYITIPRCEALDVNGNRVLSKREYHWLA